MNSGFDPFKAPIDRLMVRLQQLDELIRQLQARYDLEPRINEKGLLGIELDQAKKTYDEVLSEYQRLDNQAQSPSEELANAGTQLQSIEQKIDTMLGEQRFLTLVIARLTVQQREDTDTILATIQDNQIPTSDLQSTLAAVQNTLITVQQNGKLTGSPLEEPVAEAKAIFDDTKLDVKHKLKVTIPLIPFILSYETELGLGSGANLQAAWDNIKDRFRHKEPPANPPTPPLSNPAQA